MNTASGVALHHEGVHQWGRSPSWCHSSGVGLHHEHSLLQKAKLPLLVPLNCKRKYFIQPLSGMWIISMIPSSSRFEKCHQAILAACMSNQQGPTFHKKPKLEHNSSIWVYSRKYPFPTLVVYCSCVSYC